MALVSTPESDPSLLSITVPWVGPLLYEESGLNLPPTGVVEGVNPMRCFVAHVVDAHKWWQVRNSQNHGNLESRSLWRSMVFGCQGGWKAPLSLWPTHHSRGDLLLLQGCDALISPLFGPILSLTLSHPPRCLCMKRCYVWGWGGVQLSG